MKRYLFAATAFASAPAMAANIEIAVQGPVVEITASETVQSEPDQATVSAGVTTRAQTAVQAMRDNANKMDAVIARLRALGISREDIQTSGVNLSAAFQYNNNAPPVFQGYDVTNQVSVTLKDIPKIGPTLDALVVAGANNINGPFFRREDDKPQRRQAREAAFKAAEAQARDYARMAGFGGVRLLAVEETLTQGGPIPFDSIVVTGARAISSQKSTPVEPGRIGTVVQLTAKYELTR
jgi:uncharacterized protein YggE